MSLTLPHTCPLRWSSPLARHRILYYTLSARSPHRTAFSQHSDPQRVLSHTSKLARSYTALRKCITMVSVFPLSWPRTFLWFTGDNQPTAYLVCTAQPSLCPQPKLCLFIQAAGNGTAGNGGSPGPEKVVIAGAGIIGCATAYYLSKLGVAATVVEKGDVACASSGKAGTPLHSRWLLPALGPLLYSLALRVCSHSGCSSSPYSMLQ